MTTQKHISIRIHPHADYAEDLVQKFKTYCDHNLIEDYIMTYEDDAARPHYHTYLKTEKTEWKLKQSFKQIFPLLIGNKYFAFTQITDDEAYKKYICKNGDYKLQSDNYKTEDLEKYRTEWLKVKGEIADKKQKQKKKKEKQKQDLEELFRDYCVENVDDYPKPKLDIENCILIIKGFLLEKNILNFTPQLITKYYKILLKTLDPEAYKLYVQEFVRSSLEKNMLI